MVDLTRKSLFLFLILTFTGLYSSVVFADQADQADHLPISSFNIEGLANWEEKSFSGHTAYKIVRLDGTPALQADSRASASGIYKKIKINLQDYPYLNWRWRIDNKIDSGNESSKAGDDYAARIYVVIDGGIIFWKSKALNYVWANQSAKGTVWNNAYAGDAVKMYALRSSADGTGSWQTEKRNVYEDLKKVFGKEFPIIDSVAIMTDTDNSNGKALSYYADVYFSAN